MRERDEGRPTAAEPHVVQLYRQPASLHAAVVSWIVPGLARGGSVVLVCTPANAREIRMRLRDAGFNAGALEAADRLIVVSAGELLGRFSRDGVPDGPTFKRLARGLVERARAASADGSEILAWGEMVNILWAAGHSRGALRLEELWNELIAEEGLRLLCSYDVSSVDGDEYSALWSDVCRTHGRLVDASDTREDGAREAPRRRVGVDSGAGEPSPVA